jgi:Tfp pilus assembly protein PilE
VISDGGFTDYLSDESEAELQRQAEAKAALVAQNQAEEQEFKAARQQLAAVGLRPPKSWDETNEVIPRMQNAVGYSHHPAYTSPAYTPAAVAHSARG